VYEGRLDGAAFGTIDGYVVGVYVGGQDEPADGVVDGTFVK